jgi:hypothetical protein
MGIALFVAAGTKPTTVTTRMLLEQSPSAGIPAGLDKHGTDGEAEFSPPPGSYPVWAPSAARPPFTKFSSILHAGRISSKLTR